VNPDDNEIIAFELTDDDTSDAAMIGDLVAASGGNIRAVIADGAYDGEPTYDAIRAARPPGSPPKIVIPPKAPSIPDKGDPHGGSERKRHAAEIARHGRMAWQRRHGYGKRSLAETAFSRIKTINDGRLTSRVSAKIPAPIHWRSIEGFCVHNGDCGHNDIEWHGPFGAASGDQGSLQREAAV